MKLLKAEAEAKTKTFNIETVLYKIETHLTNDMLSDILIKWRKEYIYEIDGIIVTDDKLYPRKSGNPEHSFAFKMVLSDQMAEAKVVDVIWNASKDGYLKPRVRIEPIHLGGVTIEYATGFNAAFIENNKVGIGSLVEIIRSGDVIPHIKSVIQPAEKAKMPTVPYVWNNTHIDILLEDITNDMTVKEKNITGFFKGLGVDGLSTGNVKRIMDAGYKTIPEIMQMNEPDFLKVEGFKQTLAHKIYTGIQTKVKNASLVQLMVHSNIFGRGLSEKKIELIMEELPTILVSTVSQKEKINEISKVKGMATKSAENFVEKIDAFKSFLQEIGLSGKLSSLDDEDVDSSNANTDTSHPLYKKNIVMTGARDKELMEELKKVGANITSVVNKNTFALIAKDKDEHSNKLEDAVKLQIPIFSIDEFKQDYLEQIDK
jgi:NAD-dependent DNA ligase